jgi:hypothetical protein
MFYVQNCGVYPYHWFMVVNVQRFFLKKIIKIIDYVKVFNFWKITEKLMAEHRRFFVRVTRICGGEVLLFRNVSIHFVLNVLTNSGRTWSHNPGDCSLNPDSLPSRVLTAS